MKLFLKILLWILLLIYNVLSSYWVEFSDIHAHTHTNIGAFKKWIAICSDFQKFVFNLKHGLFSHVHQVDSPLWYYLRVWGLFCRIVHIHAKEHVEALPYNDNEFWF